MRVSTVISVVTLGGCPTGDGDAGLDAVSSDDGAAACGAGDEISYYADVDGDLHGDPDTMVMGCEPPTGFVPVGDDCNDASAAVHPGRVEICDGLDNDCNDTVDDAAVDVKIWYVDVDLDGFGVDSNATALSCDQPDGMVDNAMDCDDSTDERAPGLEEVCDGIDNDCDEDVDIDAVGQAFWVDTDGDGYGDGAFPAIDACEAPYGYVDDSSDCDDDDVDINPLGVEICGDNVDNDCFDGDEACASGEYLLDPLAFNPPQTMLGTGYFGVSVEIADVTGDGIDDLIVGASSYLGNGGALIYAGESGFTLPPSFTAADIIIDGLGGEAGRQMSTGNMNGDQYTDLLIGTGYHGVGGYAFMGPLTESAYGFTWADVHIDHGGTNNVHLLGDISGDGIDDIGCGFADFTGGTYRNGKVTTMFGESGMSGAFDCAEPDVWELEIHGPHVSYLGGQVAPLGDINGDAENDFGAIASEAGGYGYAFYGSTKGSWQTSDIAALTVTGANISTMSRSAGDVNGDTYSDVVLGAWGWDLSPQALDAGAVGIFYMPSPDASLAFSEADVLIQGDELAGHLGKNVDLVDFNGDGHADIVFSARDRGYDGSENTGSTYLVYGGPNLPAEIRVEDADLVFRGTLPEGLSGYGFAVGDLDNDGLKDFAIGAPGADTVYVMLGSQL